MIYDPLDQSRDCLRVLTLLPGVKSKDEIRCELETRTFMTKPDYEALSYTWGDAPVSHKITINGQPFSIRENLYQALERLRFPDKRRTIWVDAICINQEEVVERNYEVSLMSFIYTRARRVLVWLGPSCLPLPTDSHDEGPWEDKPAMEVARHLYWTRMWIVQELVLAADIVFCYGHRQVTWDVLNSKISGEAATVMEKTATAIMKQRFFRHSNEHRLENLIESFQGAHCAEPRDKIFGLLGMAHDCDSEVLKIDYEMPLYDLYSRMIDLHRSLPQKLGSKNMDRTLERSIMLVRFSQLVQRTLNGLVEDDVQQRKPTAYSKQFYTARGAVAGEILYLGPTHAETVGSLRANKTWKQAYEQHYQDDQDIDSVRREDEAYSRAILDWDERRLSTIRAVDTNTSYGYRLDGSAESVTIDPDTLSKPDGSEPRRFLGSNQLLGFAPPEARVGDLICRFWHCDAAIIVRRLGDEMTDQWMIVGKADIATSVQRAADFQDQVSMRYGMGEYRQVEGESRKRTYMAALKRPDFRNMINLRLDTATLQKLTC